MKQREEIEPRHPGHLLAEDDQVERDLAESREHVCAAIPLRHLMAVELESAPQERTHLSVIVDDENPRTAPLAGGRLSHRPTVRRRRTYAHAICWSKGRATA